MRLSNRNLRIYFEKNDVIPCEKAAIQKTVLRCRKAYCESEGQKSLSKLEFLYAQSKYIKKQWWLLQGTLLALLWLFLSHADSNSLLRRGIGVAAPLFILLIMPEIWKNRSSNAMEVECTTAFSIREIYAARMTLFAIVDLTLLSSFFIAASYTARLPLQELIIQFFVPFNATCCICFRLLYSRKGNSQTLAFLLCFVWIALWIQIVLNEAVYAAVSVPIWLALILLSGAYLGYSVWKGQKHCIETWEVKTLWN